MATKQQASISCVSIITGLVGFAIVTILTYKILEHIDATEVMWLLFWLHLTMGVLFRITAGILDYINKND